MKKVLSVLLLVTVLLSSFPVAAFAADKVCNCDQAPIIFVRGRRELVVDQSRPETDETNYHVPRTDHLDIPNLIMRIVPLYCFNYLIRDFSMFKKRTCDLLDEVFDEFCLDKNGEVTNNSGLPPHVRWRDIHWGDVHNKLGTITTPEQASAAIARYNYNYDCRLDPVETADDLKDYIDTIKRITGHQKVKILARCEGNIILMAYFAKYGWDDVQQVICYNSVARGTAVTDSLFTGYLALDAQGTDYIADQVLDDDPAFRLVKDVVDYVKVTRFLDVLFRYYNKTLPSVSREILPDALLHSYGSTPGYWAMVSPERYEEARNFVFAGREQEYAGLIAKLDRYHEQVAVKIDDMLRQMKADGVPVSFITKYGCQLYPITDDVTRQSDTVVSLAQQAPGVTSAPIGETFSEQYLTEQERLGNSAFVSGDHTVNAATCLYPDTTWFIRDIVHTTYPPSIDELIYRIFESNGAMTVFSNEKFPQFMQYNEEGCAKGKGVIEPLTEQGTAKTIHQYPYFTIVRNLFVHFFQLFAK